MPSNQELCKAIAHRITTSPQKRITFAEYMDMVLYHPQTGYYSTKALKLGKEGDFFTSVHLGADFGELLAVQFFQMWEILGQPVPFSLVEMGAGQGLLALDLLKYIKQQYPDFFNALDYVIVEKSSVLRQEQQQQLREFSVRWFNLEEIPTHSVTGCFFSNELVDALPVHQFVLQEGRLQEIFVTTQEEGTGNREQGAGSREQGAGNREHSKIPVSTSIPVASFVEVADTPSTTKLEEYFELVGINISSYADGYRSEVNLAALDWLSLVAERLQRGYLLTIDYGYPASRYYNPMRSQGTLQCYYNHQRHNDPYINIGTQDITTHVDFTTLERWGDRCGLDKVGFTKQALFLMALGLGERIAALSYTQQPISQLLHRRDVLHQLLDPLGIGGFGVLVQAKGLTKQEATQPLKGLSVPEQMQIS
ncbi:class I SAM-dependent methyltransferase [Brasilonema octagenarum UFV-E1]|uniref:Class I SAM-dependent methyltransferase n=1 Tax=Brasilonema sennae CENA114 TaxID=415709 RepID=A0A856MQ90_9CYAN|nr:class I SAM-dependent methyltransferase [Brasilonema sennae]QDL11761.1 class I SAM-dependent methyltransferase [Brasilonema sennae CENA114]QDL18142.1 class I SAM-dependent methyltransferase [Brasilonema octagenarum UFV-E1]